MHALPTCATLPFARVAGRGGIVLPSWIGLYPVDFRLFTDIPLRCYLRCFLNAVVARYVQIVVIATLPHVMRGKKQVVDVSVHWTVQRTAMGLKRQADLVTAESNVAMSL